MFRAPCPAEAECLDYEGQSINKDNDQIQQNLYQLCIGESPSICPFLKNNGHEAPKGPSAIIFQEWTDTRTFSYLKYTLIYNYV